MPKWFEYLIILVAVVVAVVYLIRRLRASLMGQDTLDCPFADGCDGCNCQKPELREKCGVVSDDTSCGCC